MRRKRILVGLIVIVGILFFLFSILFIIGKLMGGRGQLAFGDRIAVVEIKGIIADSTSIIEEIRQHLEDRGVKAIVLRVDSPGGGVGPSQEIYQEIKRARKTKKVIASMGSVAAAGGY